MTLDRIRALVTRPKDQGRPLTEAIIRHQGQAWQVPMLAIVPTAVSPAMGATLLDLDLFQKIIVTSANAARHGLALIDSCWPQLPVGLHWYAIGTATARVLASRGIRVRWPVQGFDSEALLAMASLKAVSGERVLLIKGQGGRQLLRATLQQRGARVSCLESYRRERPDHGGATLLAQLDRHDINVLLCASGETLDNVLRFLPEPRRAALWLVVPSLRVACLADSAGFAQVVVAADASTQGQLAALQTIQHQLSGQAMAVPD